MISEFELIVTVISRGFSDYVVEASREAGATGGTIIYARGTNLNEKNDSFMGVQIRPDKDIILTVVKKVDKANVIKSIYEKASLDIEGRGICFSLPVSDVRGINYLTNKKTNAKIKK